MDIKTFFSSRRALSARLAAELAEHLLTWPTVKAEIDALDAAAIELASQWNAEKTACSQKAGATLVALVRARERRDGRRHVYRHRQADLERQLGEFTNELRTEFSEWALRKANGLSSLYRYERLEGVRGLDGKRARSTVKISHNAAALDQGRDFILAARTAVMGMGTATLTEIENAIAGFKSKIALLDTETMEIEEVNEDRANDMKPKPPENDDFQKGTLIAPGRIHVHPPKKDKDRIGRLSDRLSKLEDKL